MGPFPHSPQSHSPDHTEIILQAPSQSGGDIMPLYIQELSAEPKAGIIRVTGKINKGFVQSFTNRVHEGPLYEIRIESAQSARVTFQYASHALAFLKSNDDMQRMLKYGRLGAGYQVELAELVDWNDDHRKMNQPIRERRRLSFARKKLFSEGLSPEKWRQDIRVLAGQSNIDFLWVFNSGNGKLADKVVLLILYQARADQTGIATAVFTSTKIARKVLEAFEKWKDGRNVYSGVSVTYSSDPCEKELVLTKEAARPVVVKSYNHGNRKATR